MTTTIPADFRPLLTECLLGTLRHTVEAVEQCGLHPDAYPEPLSEFDAIRAALDALGWGAATEIDVDAHRWALEQALADRLGIERSMQATAEADGDETGRQRAYGYVLTIETWAESAGVVVPGA
jgi:hypothetical protein